MLSRFLRTISFLIFFILVNTPVCFATISVSGVTTTTSTCGNNGTATIQATSNKTDPFLAYEILSGPTTASIQNSATFSSLFPGTYTARVYDVDFESKDVQFTITGTYQLPQPNPVAFNPTCTGGHDGKIIGNSAPLTGKAPFNWQIVSPYTGAIQSSDTFKNLPAGGYTVRVEDACGNFQSRTIFLVDNGTGFSNLYYAGVNKIGCDKIALAVSFSLRKEKSKYPLKLILTTSSGTVTKRMYPIPIDTIHSLPGVFNIADTIPGLTYGDKLKVCIEDTCGTRLCAHDSVISPYEFVLSYTTGPSCNDEMSAYIDLKQPYAYPYLYTGYITPAKMTLTDIATNAIVDSMTCSSPGCALISKPLPSGKTYKLKVVDGCGQVFQQNYLWPSPSTQFVTYYAFKGCLDSTSYIGLNFWNFKNNLKMEITSGPSVAKSTKPEYAFKDTIVYPKLYSISGNSYTIKNLPIGTYQYHVYDDCGNSVSGTFTIDPSSVSDLGYSYSIRKGCLGNNIFSFDATSPNVIGVYVKDLQNNTVYHNTMIYGPDSVTSLPPGKYLFQIYYGYDPNYGGLYFDNYITNNHQDCWLVEDTITIPYYSNDLFKASTTIFCHGNNYVALLVDSTSGLPPFLYEITSGPQTYPPQVSNLFNLPTYGNYNIRIQDACGNSNTRQISIDTTKFPPIVKKGPSCLGSKITLAGISSPYFQYDWTTPHGVISHGDSLIISPLSAADTGVYHVKKTVTVNGCSDVFYSSYHVYLHDVTVQTVNLCHKTSFKVGNHIYTSPGVYLDSLINKLGCDSIVTTTVLVNYKKRSIDSTVCEGNPVVIGLHTYTNTGIYFDTLTAANGCDSLIRLNLTVIPYKRFSFNKTICQGKSFFFAGQLRSTAGAYYDTLSTSSCDSIVKLNLSLETPPVIHLGNDTSICTGQSRTLDPGAGFAAYYWNDNFTDSTHQTFQATTAGKYWVIIKTFADCRATDTMQIITVHPLPVVSAGTDQYICSGTSAILTASSPTGVHYKWNPGAINVSSFTVSPAATSTYSITTTDANNCISNPDAVTVTVNPSPTTPPFDQPKMKYCFDNGPLSLSAKGEKYFLWSNGNTMRNIDVTEAGTYSVTVSDDSGCFIKGEIYVKDYCAPQLYYPSAFTPNGDNLHDDLEIFGKHFKNFEIQIFNRWGEIIFLSKDRTIQWDGMYRGEEMPPGSYECIIHYQGVYEEDTELLTLKGSVTLIR
ncbi:MAG TPA: gliding motility-associated C-terminal domain-containing protein [Cytophagaceae bacterium]|nr:gliding motility-associated C-terminal domain-containing protein [Cytophagaceae bacterium]